MPTRRTAALRQGRASLADARYFITFCTQKRNPALIMPVTSDAIARILTRLEEDGDWKPLAYTIMPDHIHILAVLSGRLTVSQVVGKMKALTNPTLKIAGAAWQENFFEHRLRPDEIAGAYARYIFLNPYRAQLIRQTETWPYWTKSAVHEFDFISQLIDGRLPPMEWLTTSTEMTGLRVEDVGVD
jgi:REP element-mobilizing transposase RayT